MSAFRRLFEVAKRDFLQRARSRAFLITTALTVGLILMVGPLVSLVTDQGDATKIGVVGDKGVVFTAAVASMSENVGIDTEIVQLASTADAELAVTEDDVAVAYADGELVWREDVSERLRVVVVSAVQEVERARIAEQLGLAPGELTGLLSPPVPGDRVLEPPGDDRGARLVGAQVGVFLLYMSILIFGQFVLMGVMEEKQSRVVEVVLSRITPANLLAGKILGIGLLGLVQILLIGGASLVALTVVEVEIPASLGVGLLGWVTFWYVLGYAFYATIYGAMGATVSRQEDAQGAVLIPALLIIPGFFISTIVALDDPDSPVAVVASLIPISSPMVMPVRLAAEAVSWWEVAVAIVVIVASTYLLILLAGRIYRGAILSIGAKVKLTEAWRAARS